MHPLQTLYQQFIHKTRYAKWIPEESRREEWNETVGRYTEFMENHLRENHGFHSPEMTHTLYEGIYNLDVMPSMRALMTSGPALARDHTAAYNCGFSNIVDNRSFGELCYISMCGTGNGFSVERQHVAEFPEVPETFEGTAFLDIADTKAGWADAVVFAFDNLYAGITPEFGYDKIRPAGARLKTFGGRASGPAPLKKLLEYIIYIMKGAAGRKLTSIECHDVSCMIGDVVVSGGVRRSAFLSLSNLSDQRMRDAKSGEWWKHNDHRRLANNSTAYTEKPDVGQWMTEWHSIYASKSGERGIFNREAVTRQCEKFGRRTTIMGETALISFGTNPCGEIILRPNQFCNLTEVIARKDDTVEDLFRKVRLATILGTYQSSLTDFKYLRPIWKQNCEEERLLGVSITGIMDCELLNGVSLNRSQKNALLRDLRQHATDVNVEWAAKFGIPASAAICTVKPSGTVSQLTNSSSGIHRRYAERYIRSVRNDVKDPITQFCIDQGIPYEIDNFNSDNVVFMFPIDSPEGCITRNDGTAIDELENWLDFQENWCHHNPSVTINVREREWPGVGAWVYDHFDQVAGLSFLPNDDHSYEQAPYQDATGEDILKLQDALPKHIDWSSLIEENDDTTGVQQLACTAGICEI